MAADGSLPSVEEVKTTKKRLVGKGDDVEVETVTFQRRKLPDWRAAAWLLANEDPARFGRKKAVDPPPPETTDATGAATVADFEAMDDEELVEAIDALTFGGSNGKAKTAG